MEIRRFKESDASAVSELIRTTIQISNKKDYPADLIGTSRMRAVCSPYLSIRTVRAKGSAG